MSATNSIVCGCSNTVSHSSFDQLLIERLGWEVSVCVLKPNMWLDCVCVTPQTGPE